VWEISLSIHFEGRALSFVVSLSNAVSNGIASRSKSVFGMTKYFPAALFTSRVCMHIIYCVSEIAQPKDREREHKITVVLLEPLSSISLKISFCRVFIV
jgi:hypothetical protein